MASNSNTGGVGDTSTGTSIVIGIREDGTKVVTDQISKIAAQFDRLSPKFAASLRGRALRCGANIETETRKAAGVALERVVHTTPHDTGQARANWEVEIGATPPEAIEAPNDFSKTDYDGDATIAEGMTIINGQKRRPGETYWIYNGLEYIEALNAGHSDQEPALFVERALQAAVNSVKRGLKGIFEKR